jgi:hypothetical protein
MTSVNTILLVTITYNVIASMILSMPEMLPVSFICVVIWVVLALLDKRGCNQ